MSKPIRLDSAFHVAVALLSLGLVCSCSETSPPDSRQSLVGSLKGANVEGYLFAVTETDDQRTASLTNNAVNNLITLGSGDSNLVLRYSRVLDRKTNTRSLFRTEVVKRGTSLTLAVTDMAENKVVEQRPFPPSGPACQPEGQFDSVNACIEEFDCTRKGPLQCQANCTCEPVFPALTCCLKDGTILSVHLIIRPTKIRCVLRDLVPDLDGLVLSQR